MEDGSRFGTESVTRIALQQAARKAGQKPRRGKIATLEANNRTLVRFAFVYPLIWFGVWLQQPYYREQAVIDQLAYFWSPCFLLVGAILAVARWNQSD